MRHVRATEGKPRKPPGAPSLSLPGRQAKPLPDSSILEPSTKEGSSKVNLFTDTHDAWYRCLQSEYKKLALCYVHHLCHEYHEHHESSTFQLSNVINQSLLTTWWPWLAVTSWILSRFPWRTSAKSEERRAPASVAVFLTRKKHTVLHQPEGLKGPPSNYAPWTILMQNYSVVLCMFGVNFCSKYEKNHVCSARHTCFRHNTQQSFKYS